MVPSGIRNFFGCLKSSLINQPLMFTGVVLVFNNSIVSRSGKSVCDNTSFTSTGATVTGGTESPPPGVPLSYVLGRQLCLRPQLSQGAESFLMTSEAPAPSVMGYHELLYLKS